MGSFLLFFGNLNLELQFIRTQARRDAAFTTERLAAMQARRDPAFTATPAKPPQARRNTAFTSERKQP